MREFFNAYVREVFPERRAAAGADWPWPGDEWVDEAMREATWHWLAGGLPAALRQVVEFGPGSGKYTELLLQRTPARVVAYEISDAFIGALAQRCAGFCAARRLDPRLIDWTDNEGLLRDLGGAVGTIDTVVAVDVLMMMDFQSAFVYLASAAAMLRRGGRLLVTLADGGSTSGLDRMLRDAGRHSAFDGSPCTRFHWVDRSLVETVLPALGFGRIEISHGPDKGLDIARLYVTAELVDADLARRRAACLAPAGGSTNRRREAVAS